MVKKIFRKIRDRFLVPVNRSLSELEVKSNVILSKLDMISKKLALDENILVTNEANFFIPNSPQDLIQTYMLNARDFWERDLLKKLDKYICQDSIILDIGANIGNHTIYWGKITKVKRIYAFEPIASTYRILEKNIQINNLSTVVKSFNYCLGDKSTQARIRKGHYTPDNIGATSLEANNGGGICIHALDDIDEIKRETEIHFCKIDCEGFEKWVLLGMKQTFLRCRPIVLIESFPGIEQFDFVYDFMRKLGYEEPEAMGESNYLFVYDKQLGSET